MITVKEKGIIKLWSKTFGDSYEYVESFIDTFSNKAEFLTKEVNSETASMLCMIDCSLSDKKGKYIYACATDDEYRKSGFMTQLLNEARDKAQKDGYDFLVLVPATESLFDYYEKRGYKKFFKVKEIKVLSKILKILSKGETVKKDADAKKINEMRKAFLTKSPAVIWTDEQMQFLTKTYDKVLYSENIGYAFLREENNTVYIDEICADKQRFCEVLKLVSDNTDADNYCFYVPMDCPFTSDSFEIKNKGMILPLKNLIDTEGYIGLVME